MTCTNHVGTRAHTVFGVASVTTCPTCSSYGPIHLRASSVLQRRKGTQSNGHGIPVSDWVLPSCILTGIRKGADLQQERPHQNDRRSCKPASNPAREEIL